jgi:hypothetical protein
MKQQSDLQPKEFIYKGNDLYYNFNINKVTETDEVSGKEREFWEFDQVKVKNKNDAILKSFEFNVEKLIEGYPQFERDTFSVQDSEARAWLLDNTTSTPLIDAISSSRGIEKSELINKIIIKSDKFKSMVGTVIGEKQKIIG